METYKCRLNSDDPSDTTEIETPAENDPEWAAEAYAEKIRDNRDMWELGDDWGDEDYAVVVISPDGTETTWSITLTWYPHFSASRVEKPVEGNS